jgi:hypothetical protein
MEITIFAKKRQTKDGRIFWSYLSTLTKKDGEKVTVSVKFREECGSPKPEDCPMNIIFEKHEGNMSSRDFVREDTGELFTSYTLWLSGWKVGEPYVDHSLDEYF